MSKDNKKEFKELRKSVGDAELTTSNPIPINIPKEIEPEI